MGLGMGLGNGLVQLAKRFGKGIGNAADNFWLGADAQKAIRDEVEKKFKPRIDRAQKAKSRRAENIKELGDKLTQSKKDLQDAKDAWKDKYNTALADAKSQRQTDIDTYNTRLKSYEDALNDAKVNKQNILDQLSDAEASYNPYKTIYTDVHTGDRYRLNRFTGTYENLTQSYAKLTKTGKRKLESEIQDYDDRLFDSKSKKVINAFDESNINQYRGQNPYFENYFDNRISTQQAAIRDADNQINKATSDLTNWQNNQPQAWDDIKDLNQFKTDFKKTNGSAPTKYSFNGTKYSDEKALDTAYKQALKNEQVRRNTANNALDSAQKGRDAEIAQRIQYAKDINKAKVTLGGTLGAGALYAGARAMYGGDDTDNIDNTNNTNNTNNIDNGEPDPNFNIKNIPEVQAQLNDEQQSDTASINTGFNPDKADALASAAYDQGVEDGNSIASSDDLSNKIAASTGGHTIDDKLFELIKAMQDPYKADAVANYIYSRHGNNPELQRLGWRAWLNKYYGDSLRSMMNIDPSGYKGMHISGGL